MTKQVPFSEEKLNVKKQTLDDTARQLKKEFIGINAVIDHLIETVGCWYIFPELQERPVVVNLWGMTGVGKTSLVERLAHLLGFEKKFYHFDLGINSDSASSVRKHLKSLFSYSNGEPAIIALDEFQHARTLNERGSEIDKYYSRVIWELLDSGKFQSSRHKSCVGSLYKLIQRVRFFVDQGVKVSQGKVTEKADFFCEIMKMGNPSYLELDEGYFLEDGPDPDEHLDKENKKNNDPLWFLPHNTAGMLFELSGNLFSNVFELTKHLLSLDAEGILHFLEEILAYARSRKIVDCSKSLIIVMGNLDEAYTMSGNFNPDINADEFYEMSLRIKLPDIKNALLHRFRHEQIARLGNNHIIYPAFSSKSYEQLILLELNDIALKVKRKFGWTLSYTEAMKALIYREGVFPTQGTRPLFSTVQQLVHSRIARIAYEAAIHRLCTDKVQLHFDNEMIIIRFYKGEKMLHVYKEKPELNLEKLREPKRGDAQALTAVHESGHAVLSLMLMKTIPECIFSMTVDGEAAGYVLMKSDRKYLSREGILQQMAVYLGGIVAEEMIFGKNHITTGSEDDLRKATSLAAGAIKEYGMGRLMASIQVKDHKRNTYIHDTADEHNRLAEQWVEEARNLAERCLKENETLLLHIADYLSDQRVMQKEVILRFVRLFSDVGEDYFIQNPDHVFYRRHLKERLAAMDEKPGAVQADRSMLLSLNKEQTSIPIVNEDDKDICI